MVFSHLPVHGLCYMHYRQENTMYALNLLQYFFMEQHHAFMEYINPHIYKAISKKDQP